MKSQFRCILFALIALPAACGGDRSTSTTSSGDTLVPRQPVTPPAPIASPEPAHAEPDKLAPVASTVSVPAALPTTYSEALAQGKALAAAGEHARAKELFEAACKLDRKAADPHIELSRLFIATGERGLAITAANKAIKLAPDSSQAYNTLGRAELARFNYDNAILAFRQATERNPDNVWAWNNLGYTQLQLKHYQEAADALVEATTHKGTEGYMWNNLGTAYEHLDQLDDARAAFDSGSKLGSKEALASRKRLEGVKTIAVLPPVKHDAKAAGSKGYDLFEDMPPISAGSDPGATPEAAAPAADPDEPKADEPKLDGADDDGPNADGTSEEAAPAPAEKPALPSPI